jgi:hypothetical protein
VITAFLFLIVGLPRLDESLYSGGRARTMDFQEVDVGYIDRSMPHYIENTGEDREEGSSDVPE